MWWRKICLTLLMLIVLLAIIARWLCSNVSIYGCQNNLFKDLLRGGQFGPKMGGQFGAKTGGQFTPESGGQFQRFFQLIQNNY